MTVDISRLDADPASFPWWRVVSGQVSDTRTKLNSLISNGAADYKQLSATIESLTQQYNALNEYVGRIPTSTTQSTSVSGWAVSTADPTWSTIHTQTFTVPDNTNFAVIGSALDIQYFSGGGGADFRINANGTVSRYGYSSGSGSFGTSVSVGSQGAVTPGATITVTVDARYHTSTTGANVNNLLSLNTIVNWQNL